MARKVSPQVSSVLLAFAMLFFLASVFAAVGAGVTARGNDLFISGNVGIGTTDPQSRLQVVGNYIQIPKNENSAPPASDCDNVAEMGRMLLNTPPVEERINHLYICGMNKNTVEWRIWDSKQ